MTIQQFCYMLFFLTEDGFIKCLTQSIIPKRLFIVSVQKADIHTSKAAGDHKRL